MIVIIDYRMGNIRSVAKAFRKLNASFVISNKPADIKKASHLVLPGVGAFGDGMDNLKRLGLIPLLEEEVFKKKKPFLGICIGMQLLATAGKEHGNHKGLGWIKGMVRRFSVDDAQYKIPHIGWNDITIRINQPLFADIPNKSDMYFVHSFHLVPAEKEVIAATCNYGEEFVAALQKDNVFGLQFHPEKSQLQGIQVIKNFLNTRQSAYAPSFAKASEGKKVSADVKNSNFTNVQ